MKPWKSVYTEMLVKTTPLGALHFCLQKTRGFTNRTIYGAVPIVFLILQNYLYNLWFQKFETFFILSREALTNPSNSGAGLDKELLNSGCA